MASEQVEISLFCTQHFTGWRKEWHWNLLFLFCFVVGQLCGLGDPAFCSLSVTVALVSLIVSSGIICRNVLWMALGDSSSNNFFQTYPKCSLPNPVSRKTIKKIGHRAWKKDMMAQSYLWSRIFVFKACKENKAHNALWVAIVQFTHFSMQLETAPLAFYDWVCLQQPNNN